MRLIYIEVSPIVVRACNGAGSFRMLDPEPIVVQMLESPNAVYSETEHGPVGLYLLVLATEKYITIMQEVVQRHEQVASKGDASSMERIYNLLKARLESAEANLKLLKEAQNVAKTAVASCN